MYMQIIGLCCQKIKFVIVCLNFKFTQLTNKQKKTEKNAYPHLSVSCLLSGTEHLRFINKTEERNLFFFYSFSFCFKTIKCAIYCLLCKIYIIDLVSVHSTETAIFLYMIQINNKVLIIKKKKIYNHTKHNFVFYKIEKKKC